MQQVKIRQPAVLGKIAILVLTIGLVGTAALMSTTVNSTARSHLMSTAALLASEKLEDLGRFDKNDTPIQPGGSLPPANQSPTRQRGSSHHPR